MCSTRRARRSSARCPALGYHNVGEVSIAKTIRLVIDAASADAARDQIDEMCQSLLANPVIEQYTIAITELSPA